MKFGGDVLQMLTCLMVQPVCLAVLGDEQKEREDTTRQSGLYNIFESG